MKIEYLVYYKNKNSNKRVDSQSAYPISKEIYTHLIEHIQTHGEPCDVEVTTTTTFGGVPTQAKVLFKKEHIRRVETTIDFDIEQNEKSVTIDPVVEVKKNTLTNEIIEKNMELSKEMTEVKTNIVDEIIEETEETEEIQVEINVPKIEETIVEEVQEVEELTVDETDETDGDVFSISY